MRVLHLLKTAKGASWGLRQMRELVLLGVEVHVALPAGPMVKHYQAAGVVTHEVDTAIDIRRPLRNIRIFRELRKLVDYVQPDIIHSHFVANTLTMRIALGRNHKIKRIFHVPGPLHLEYPFFRFAEILTAGESDFWLASCEWTRARYLKSGVASRRLGLAYYGVDFEGLRNSQRSHKLRSEFGLDADTPVVGNVAYFYAPKRYLNQKRGLKGHEDLIDAVKIAGVEIPGLTCFLVGGPWGNSNRYFEQVKKKAESVKEAKIILTGFRSDVHEIYPDFDVAIHPSHSENIGGAVESLAHKVPTIATEVGGFPDVVVPGETGWLVPPKDPLALSGALIEAFSDIANARRLAEKGHDKVKALLDVKKNAAAILEYYIVLLNEGCLTPAGR